MACSHLSQVTIPKLRVIVLLDPAGGIVLSHKANDDATGRPYTGPKWITCSSVLTASPP